MRRKITKDAVKHIMTEETLKELYNSPANPVDDYIGFTKLEAASLQIFGRMVTNELFQEVVLGEIFNLSIKYAKELLKRCNE